MLLGSKGAGKMSKLFFYSKLEITNRNIVFKPRMGDILIESKDDIAIKAP